MKCAKCGNELRIEESYHGTENGKPMYKQKGTCPVCKEEYDLGIVEQTKEEKKHSTLSIWACVLAIFTFTAPIAFILALVDLCQNDKTKKHIGSWFAVIFGIFAIIILNIIRLR